MTNTAEKALLGTFLKENYLLKDTTIKPEHLSVAHHQALLSEMLKLTEQQKSVDLVTLTTLGQPENFGGVSYINELLTYANPKKFDEFEELVKESWKEREKLNILRVATEENWEIARIASELDKINEAKMDDHTTIGEALTHMYEAPWTEKEVKRGVSSGIRRLDVMTNGWQDAEVTIIAARPSMGKSDVMIHLAKQAGWLGCLPLVFSLEMPADSITSRMIASTGGYNRLKMRNPYRMLSDRQKESWSKTVGLVSETNMQIFDGAGQSIAEIRAKTRKMMHKHGKKPVIFIDYLTLIRPANFYGGNAHMQVTEISKNLKGMAKEFGCPVVCLAQLSRAVEQRQDKRPMMSDIRESGSVEQDADVIMFLYRDKYYNKDSDDDTLELIIAKNRNGPVGTVRTKYNEHTGVIVDADN